MNASRNLNQLMRIEHELGKHHGLQGNKPLKMLNYEWGDIQILPFLKCKTIEAH
ncbi:MAG: hypothetical protein MZV64_12025 [Ignavibacteriales bacterium]|nr:hypothetical protein [Ignavibacteriales bacterium]